MHYILYLLYFMPSCLYLLIPFAQFAFSHMYFHFYVEYRKKTNEYIKNKKWFCSLTTIKQANKTKLKYVSPVLEENMYLRY